MQTALLVVHVILTISLIGLILIQRGKGADIGAAFGSGASQTVFGSQGSASFLTRTTAVLATLFFITSLSLAYLSGQRVERKSVTDIVPAPAAQVDQNELNTDTLAPVDVPSVPSEVPASESPAQDQQP